MSDAGHFPGKAEEEFPIEAPAPQGDKAPEGDKPEAEKPEGDKPETGKDPAPEGDQPKDEPEKAEPEINKPRSIYEAKQAEKERRKAAEVRVKELEEENARLRGDNPPKDAPKPELEKPADKPVDELEAFAKEQGVDPATIKRLAEILAKSIPQADLTKEERQQLAELKTWQQGKLQEEQRATEDRAIMDQSKAVREQMKGLGFEIHVDAELEAIMAEVVKLAHTERFADKEVDYIVYANREALSKLVSPKKPSFEGGADAAPNAEPSEVTFSGKMTPAAAQKAVESSYPKSPLEIRRGS